MSENKKIGNFGSLSHVRTVPSVMIKEAHFTKDPLYTIAIPTFKRAELLKETLNSALQFDDSYNYDVIVVDNNPERGDATELLMQDVKSEKVSYYKNTENLGLTGNWNKLYTLAKGKWVIMLHDDDMLCPNYFNVVEQLINHLDEENVTILPASSSTYQMEETYDKIKYLNVKPWHFMLGNPSFPTGMCMLKTMFFDLDGFDESYYPSLDCHFNLRACKQYKMVKILSPTILFYRLGLNVSGKEETMKCFFEKDRLIRNIVLKDMKWPVRKIWQAFHRNHDYLYMSYSSQRFNRKYSVDGIHDRDRFLIDKFYRKVVYKISYLAKRFDTRTFRCNC